MLKNLTEQRPADIFQRDTRTNSVRFQELSDQRACHAALTATGTSSGDAASIIRDLTSVVPATGAGVSLPGALHGRQLWIKNTGSVTITVYPESTDQIDALGTAVGYALSSAGFVSFTSITDNQWYSK